MKEKKNTESRKLLPDFIVPYIRNPQGGEDISSTENKKKRKEILTTAVYVSKT